MSGTYEKDEVFNWDYDGPIIEAAGVKKHFQQNSGLINALLGGETKYVRAVDGVDLSISSGETVGLVGESGCGKTTLGMVLTGLQQPTEGDIRFLGQDVSQMNKRQRKAFRRNVQVIFQDPYESINPRFTVNDWLREPLQIHNIDNKDDRIRLALERAELTPPEQYLPQHPHELSGGQRQRVAIARALVLEPKFLLADEPVSMLDVSVRASILELLKSLVDELDMGALYISHDLSMIRQMCDRTAVMYLGNVVEKSDSETVIRSPKHPYTRALLQAVPVPNPSHQVSKPPLSGEPPDPIDLPVGCNFRPRCPYAAEECMEEPDLDAYVNENPSYSSAPQKAACWRVDAIESEPEG